jgi:hypothetical protein
MTDLTWDFIEQELAVKYAIDLSRFYLGSLRGDTLEDEAVFYHVDSDNYAFHVND